MTILTPQDLAILLLRLYDLVPHDVRISVDVFHPREFPLHAAEKTAEVIRPNEHVWLAVSDPVPEEDPDVMPPPESVQIEIGPRSWLKSRCRIYNVWESREGEVPDLNIDSRTFSNCQIDRVTQCKMWDLIYPSGYTLFVERVDRVQIPRASIE
jgi:hypothetical protein